MHKFRLIISLIVLIIFLACSSWGNNADNADLAYVLSNIKIGKQLLLVCKEYGSVRGILLDNDGRTIVLGVDQKYHQKKQPRRLNYKPRLDESGWKPLEAKTKVSHSSIGKLYIRGNITSEAAVISGISMGMMSLLSAIVTVNLGTESNPIPRIAVSTVAAGAIGAWMGAVVGSLIPKWKLVYRNSFILSPAEREAIAIRNRALIDSERKVIAKMLPTIATVFPVAPDLGRDQALAGIGVLEKVTLNCTGLGKFDGYMIRSENDTTTVDVERATYVDWFAWSGTDSSSGDPDWQPIRHKIKVPNSSIIEVYGMGTAERSGAIFGALMGTGGMLAWRILKENNAVRPEGSSAYISSGIKGFLAGISFGGLLGSLSHEQKLLYRKKESAKQSDAVVAPDTVVSNRADKRFSPTFSIRPEPYRPPDGRPGISTVTASIGVRISW